MRWGDSDNEEGKSILEISETLRWFRYKLRLLGLSNEDLVCYKHTEEYLAIISNASDERNGTGQGPKYIWVAQTWWFKFREVNTQKTRLHTPTKISKVKIGQCLSR